MYHFYTLVICYRRIEDVHEAVEYYYYYCSRPLPFLSLTLHSLI